MNKVILMGRLTRDPDVRYSTSDGASSASVARYTLAVDRRYKKENEPTADFINCVAFGKVAEFAERYLHQGTKIVIDGRIQTGSYTNKDGNKVYTTDVVVENSEFAESKATAQQNGVNTDTAKPARPSSTDADGFMSIPDNLGDEGLPF